jgi:hypothetical protein
MLRIFGLSVLVTVAVLAATAVLGGAEAFVLVAILAVLEISLSFDNAVVNAKVLQRMTVWWQQLFLTVGVLIAVFGMRLLFPLLIVAVTAQLSPREAFSLAMDDPDAYAAQMASAHPAIASFGGAFLLMIFLDFLVQEREHLWLRPLERATARLGRIEALPIAVALSLLLALAQLVPAEEVATVLSSGIAGLLTYVLVSGLAAFFEHRTDTADQVLVTGAAAFFLFLYLQVLDASFSFDGVIGAFAITSNIFLVAAGLGIGAMFIRSMTVFLVRRGTLTSYVYLEHGAHYAIGALALLLFAGLLVEIPDVVTGLIGVGFILGAVASSVRWRRRMGMG